MDWEHLLSTKRVRDLLQGNEGPTTHKTDHEFRTEFERDYGRAVFSTPVRRLLDKAQVFPLDPHDAIRTRLTHSHEVTSVARGLSRSLGIRLLQEGKLKRQVDAIAIEDIATTCALIHDLGNPPFGHAGERAIQDWFQVADRLPKGEHDAPLALDFTNFDGNAQTIRLVSKLQFISDSYGLNFTCGTLSAAFKYIADARTIDKNFHPRKKIGVFASEVSLRDAVQEETGTGFRRNPITYIVEASDDMVYSTVDIEDAVKKRAIEWKQVEEIIAGSGCQLAIDSLKSAQSYVDRDPLLIGPERDSAVAQMLRTFIIANSAPAILNAFFERYDAIMSGELKTELVEVSAAADAIALLKQIGRKHIYTSVDVLRLEVMGRNVLHGLLDIFNEGVQQAPRPEPGTYSEKVYNLISENYRRALAHAIENDSLPPWYLRSRLLVDYISGMTDTFACTLHSQLLHGG